MTASNTFGRATVLALTNKSGGGVVAGDVVILDTSNNDAFTTTTSAATTQIVGIATGTIASNAVGLVLFSGYASLVNVNASVTRGHYGATHTVAKQAADAGATRASGTFCEFLTGGTTPDAIIYNPDLGGASLTNPMTTKGDIIIADTGGTPTRLAATTSGYVLTAAGAGAFPAWQAPLAFGTPYRRTSGNYSITATSFGDIDATNLNWTVATGARRAKAILDFNATPSASGLTIDLLLDGALVGGGDGGVFYSTVTVPTHFHLEVLTDVLSAASHTFKWQARMNVGGTGTIYGGTAAPATPLLAWVEETRFTS